MLMILLYIPKVVQILLLYKETLLHFHFSKQLYSTIVLIQLNKNQIVAN